MAKCNGNRVVDQILPFLLESYHSGCCSLLFFGYWDISDGTFLSEKFCVSSLPDLPLISYLTTNFDHSFTINLFFSLPSSGPRNEQRKSIDLALWLRQTPPHVSCGTLQLGAYSWEREKKSPFYFPHSRIWLFVQNKIGKPRQDTARRILILHPRNWICKKFCLLACICFFLNS